MNTTGDRIRARRKLLGFTQRELASRVGVKHATVSQWETSDTIPAGDNLDALCRCLRTSTLWSLKGKGEPDFLQEELNNRNTVLLGTTISGKVPLIDWFEVRKFVMENENFDYKKVKHWQYTTSTTSSRAFAIKVTGDTMVNPSGGMPTMPEGSILIITVDDACELVGVVTQVVFDLRTA
jgi:transcriptional regulator with XRE-family HTH domain